MPLKRSIAEWEWDDENIEELARHGILPEIVYDVFEGNPRFRANKRHRAATHQMIGPDRSGAIWVLCIKEVERHSHVWRAITGWGADEAEARWYGRQK